MNENSIRKGTNNIGVKKSIIFENGSNGNVLIGTSSESFKANKNVLTKSKKVSFSRSENSQEEGIARKNNFKSRKNVSSKSKFGGRKFGDKTNTRVVSNSSSKAKKSSLVSGVSEDSQNRKISQTNSRNSLKSRKSNDGKDSQSGSPLIGYENASSKEKRGRNWNVPQGISPETIQIHGQNG